MFLPANRFQRLFDWPQLRMGGLICAGFVASLILLTLIGCGRNPGVPIPKGGHPLQLDHATIQLASELEPYRTTEESPFHGDVVKRDQLRNYLAKWSLTQPEGQPPMKLLYCSEDTLEINLETTASWAPSQISVSGMSGLVTNRSVFFGLDEVQEVIRILDKFQEWATISSKNDLDKEFKGPLGKVRATEFQFVFRWEKPSLEGHIPGEFSVWMWFAPEEVEAMKSLLQRIPELREKTLAGLNEEIQAQLPSEMKKQQDMTAQKQREEETLQREKEKKELTRRLLK